MSGDGTRPGSAGSHDLDDDEPGGGDLSIGDLSERTGLSPATLRMWEQRHGFPVPRRRSSGHRRYSQADVAAVQRVRERQADGVRLGAAISQVLAAADDAHPGAPSVYAELRARHPHVETQRLSKATLLALSWAIEDEFCAKARRPLLFGSFQRGRYFAQSDRRWAELARTARRTYVLGGFHGSGDEAAPVGDRVVTVDVPDDAPLRREWAVVCESEELPVALTAWELPGQSRVRDADRMFEAVWTLDPVAVRDAARVCARVCADLGAPGANDVVTSLTEPPRNAGADLASVTSMLTRMIGYLDRSRT